MRLHLVSEKKKKNHIDRQTLKSKTKTCFDQKYVIKLRNTSSKFCRLSVFF